MGLVSRTPFFEPVIPVPMLESLKIKDSLKEQRQEAEHLIRQGQDMYRAYWQNGHHPLVNAETAKWGLRHTDQTTLQPNRSENRAWMERIAWEAVNPIPMRAVCSYFDKLGPVAKAIEDKPHIGFACVTGFPHGHNSPQEAYNEIKRFALATQHMNNPREADSVMNYVACMEGNHALANDVLRAESEACKEFGLNWKPILNVCVDAHSGLNTQYGRDFFRSVYDRTMMILSHGGNPKTSTGQSTKPPYNDFDPKDAGHPIAAMPMLVATRDFNREHGTQFFNKISGGVESEVDIALYKNNFEQLYPDQPEIVERMAYGANYRLRKRVIDYLIAQNDPDVDPSFGLPYGLDLEALTPAAGGLIDFRTKNAANLDQPKPITPAPHAPALFGPDV